MGEYKYYAFISYSRKDSRAAAWLQRQLEHFRIPVRHVALENRPVKGKFVRPVFRDKRDLETTEGSFTNDVRKALLDSRYLLVVCSPRSARSKWVNEEVKYFLENNGNNMSRVVPIILDGDPVGRGETSCLPEILRRREVFERNLPTMIPDEGEKESEGWENGLIQTLCYLLHVKRENVKASIDAERVRQMKIYAVIGVVCMCIFAILALWAVMAERRAEENRRIAEANERRAVQGEAEAQSQRSRAEKNELRALAEEREAKGEREVATKMVDFLLDVLNLADPKRAGHYGVTVADALREKAKDVPLIEPPNLRAYIACRMGSVLDNIGDGLSASNLIFSAVDYYQANKYSSLEHAYALYLAGWWFARSENFASALNYGKAALGLYQRHSYDKHSLAMAYNGVGVFLMYNSCDQEATNYLQQAINLRKKYLRDDYASMSLCYNNLGFARLKLGDKFGALKAQTAALEILSSYNATNHINMAKALRGLGEIYFSMGDYSEAVNSFYKALEVCAYANEKSEKYVFSILMLLGMSYEKAGRDMDAISTYKKAIEVGCSSQGVQSDQVRQARNRLKLLMDKHNDK